MSIYTRAGDQGETDLLGGVRVSKDSALLEYCGTLDELGAALGVVRCEPLPEGCAALLERIQRELFQLGAELVAAASKHPAGPGGIGLDLVAALEQAIDRYDGILEPPGAFLLSAGNRACALLHVARTVCRRAERRLVALLGDRPEMAVSPYWLPYLNRLGDLLFVLARAANAQAGIADSPC